MNKTVPSALPGVLLLVGWVLILAGFAGGVWLAWVNPNDLLIPALVFFGGLSQGIVHLGLAAVLRRLPALP